MNETTILSAILDKGVTGGLLALAVWYVAKKLASQYEARIAALEQSVKDCDTDRKYLRDLLIPNPQSTHTTSHQ